MHLFPPTQLFPSAPSLLLTPPLFHSSSPVLSSPYPCSYLALWLSSADALACRLLVFINLPYLVMYLLGNFAPGFMGSVKQRVNRMTEEWQSKGEQGEGRGEGVIARGVSQCSPAVTPSSAPV
jgi:hypothetical protein